MSEFIHVTAAKYLHGHALWLRFSDQSEGEIDLQNALEGKIFKPLQDEAIFADFRLEGGTITWPNGADLAPEYLRDQLT